MPKQIHGTNMWSWILACVGVVGTFFVGRKTIWGWVVLFVNECLWLVYATQTKQYGFYLGSVAYMMVYVKSYLHWSKSNAISAKSASAETI